MTSTFRHAVASFEPTSTAVLLWTRLSGGATAADLVVARDPALEDVVHRSSHETGPDLDHTIVVDVGDLEAATSYWYRFSVGDDHSPVGRTRLLPDGAVDRFRIGLVSCARYSVAPLGVYRALAEREVDLVLHLGDYMYEDDGAKGPRRHDPPHTTVTRDDYRRRLAQLRADPDLQAVHLRHPMVTIWDDHDLADNAWRTGAKAHDPDEHGSWEDRADAAARARQEWVPGRLLDPEDPFVTWRSLTIGDLAEVVLLDTRFAGRHRHAGDDGTLPLDSPQRSLLGDDQRSWLQDRLASSRQPWAIVASGVVINELQLQWPRVLTTLNVLLPNGYAVIDGKVLHDDQWDGYPEERRRLARWARDRGRTGRRTLLLSGDVHSSWAFTGPDDPDVDPDGDAASPVAVEFTVPAVSSAAMGRAHYPALSVLLDRAVKRMDHVRWAEVTRRGYTILDITPERAQAEWWFVMPYSDDPAGTADLGATIVTEHHDWPPRLDQVEAPTTDPVRLDLPAALPPRPADLAALRRRRRARLTALAVAPALALGGAAALASLLRRRG